MTITNKPNIDNDNKLYKPNEITTINNLKTLSIYTADLLTGALPRGYGKVISLALAEEKNSSGEATN